MEEKDAREKFQKAFVKFIALKKKIETVKSYDDFVNVFFTDTDNVLKEYFGSLNQFKPESLDYRGLNTAYNRAIEENVFGLKDNFTNWVEQYQQTCKK